MSEEDPPSITSFNLSAGRSTEVYNQPAFYVSTEGGTPTIVYLRSCPSSDAFYEIIPQAVDVRPHRVKEILVTFKWIVDTEESTIRLNPAAPDSYEKMMEEIQRAPGLYSKGGRVSVFVRVVPQSESSARKLDARHERRTSTVEPGVLLESGVPSVFPSRV